MGRIKIVDKGLELDGTALLMDKMKTSHIKARYCKLTSFATNLTYIFKCFLFDRPGQPITFGNRIMSLFNDTLISYRPFFIKHRVS